MASGHGTGATTEPSEENSGGQKWTTDVGILSNLGIWGRITEFTGICLHLTHVQMLDVE